MTIKKVVIAAAGAFALAAIGAMLPWPAAALPLMAPYAASPPPCPSSWPSETAEGPVPLERYGRISYQDFHADANGDRWFVVRSTDSNGNTLGLAYPADDRYQAGYGVAPSNETCYMRLRRPGDAADLDPPERIIFPPEREERVASNDTRIMEPEEPTTLRQILAAMRPAQRVNAILCLVSVAGNVDPNQFLDDPAYVPIAIAAGCIRPQ